MTHREAIHTDEAPAAIGPYSQAVKSGNLLFISGQIGFDPATMEIVDGGVEAQARQVFTNLAAVARAGGASLQDAVKLTIYLTDLDSFAQVNELMAGVFDEPFPARATIEVSALPRGALVEIDAILAL